MAPSSISRAPLRFGIDQLGVDEATRAQVHSVLFLALSPERHPDVTDAHRLGDSRTPALFELRTKRRLAAAGLTRHEDPLDARPLQIELPLRRPLDEIGGIRRREHRRVGAESLHRLHQPLGVSRADRYVTDADAVECG